MKRQLLFLGLCLVGAAAARGQAENPDYRIKAQFRDADDESVGNANFRIKSRFLQVYYGGVSRHDEFRFQVELDSPAFANQSFDVFLKNFMVGSVSTNSAGFVDQTYRSDFKPDDAPDRPLPVGFPDPVNEGDVVSIFDSATHALLLSSALGEGFARGDVDQDGDVDRDDLVPWRSHYGAGGIGPVNGDYSGDSRDDGLDFLTWQQNVTGPRGRACGGDSRAGFSRTGRCRGGCCRGCAAAAQCSVSRSGDGVAAGRGFGGLPHFNARRLRDGLTSESLATPNN